MSDLVEFLRARLDEREAKARAAGEDRIAWLTYLTAESEMHYTTVAAEAMTDVWVADGEELPDPARVLVVYDPARELREVERDRRLIDEHEITDQGCETCGNYDPTGLHAHETDGPCPTLRLLALPDADHPDYDEDWKP